MTKEEIRSAMEAEGEKMIAARERILQARRAIQDAGECESDAQKRMEELHDELQSILRKENRDAADPDLVARTEEWGRKLSECWKDNLDHALDDNEVLHRYRMFILFMQQNGIKLRNIVDNFYHEDPDDGCEYGGWYESEAGRPAFSTVDFIPSIYQSNKRAVWVEVPDINLTIDIMVPWDDWRRYGEAPMHTGLGKMIVYPTK